MGRNGYKAITFCGERRVVAADDGAHVLVELVLDVDADNPEVATRRILAGAHGVPGDEDAPQGVDARLSKPDGVFYDASSDSVFFIDRHTRKLRRVRMEPPHAVDTVISLVAMRPEEAQKFDPTRVLVSPDGSRCFISERLCGMVLLVEDLRGSPSVRVYLHNPELPVLHGMSWPVAPVCSHPLWDVDPSDWPEGATTAEPVPAVDGDGGRGLPVGTSAFLLSAQTSLWLVQADAAPGASPQARCLADMTNWTTKPGVFQNLECPSLTSNTLVVLNRNSRGTGLWQLTLPRVGAFSPAPDASGPPPPSRRWLANDGLQGPHGLALAPSRSRAVVTSTGEGHGGWFALVRLALSPDSPTVRVCSWTRLALREAGEVEAPRILASAEAKEEKEEEGGEDNEQAAHAARSYEGLMDRNLPIVTPFEAWHHSVGRLMRGP